MATYTWEEWCDILRAALRERGEGYPPGHFTNAWTWFRRQYDQGRSAWTAADGYADGEHEED